jgi:hypothetical protein
MSISRFARGLATLGAALVLALPVLAGETAEVELKAGYVDPKSGVKVEDIVVLPGQDVQAVRLAVPRTGEPIEEMVVTARRPSGEPVLQLKPHEFVRDYDRNYYGLVIYLGKNETMPLRLYMDSTQQRPGPIQP